MQFKEVRIDGQPRYVFILTKDESMVFRHATRGKKAPTDEKIIHFDLATGTIWASDRHQLVTLTADSEFEPNPEWPQREFVLDALEFKAFVTSTKSAELLVIDTEARSGGAMYKKDITNGDTLELRPLGGFTDPGAYSNHTKDIQGMLSEVNAGREHGAPTFNMSTRFGSTLAAIAKATKDQEAMVFVAPPDHRSVVTWMVTDDVDGARWMLMAMPMLPEVSA